MYKKVEKEEFMKHIDSYPKGELVSRYCALGDPPVTLYCDKSHDLNGSMAYISHQYTFDKPENLNGWEYYIYKDEGDARTDNITHGGTGEVCDSCDRETLPLADIAITMRFDENGVHSICKECLEYGLSLVNED